VKKKLLDTVLEAISSEEEECERRPRMRPIWRRGGCAAPSHIVYEIHTHTVTINNGACPDWEFVGPVQSGPRR
jgi:hypothetical protein